MFFDEPEDLLGSDLVTVSSFDILYDWGRLGPDLPLVYGHGMSLARTQCVVPIESTWLTLPVSVLKSIQATFPLNTQEVMMPDGPAEYGPARAKAFKPHTGCREVLPDGIMPAMHPDVVLYRNPVDPESQLPHGSEAGPWHVHDAYFASGRLRYRREDVRDLPGHVFLTHEGRAMRKQQRLVVTGDLYRALYALEATSACDWRRVEIAD
ncbi:MAG: hypothetical protein KC983_02715 [Phycisphaerales bacterium]|nr:hypothetical protein [Phycisphaerales bacterium]